MRTGSAGTVQFVQVRRIQQRQRLRLQQKPVLTQSVRQLAELLMLNRQELREAIREALESNPMLEIAVSSEAEGPAEVPESATADLPLGGDDSEEPAVGDSLGEIDLEAYFDEGMDPIPTEEAADAHGQRSAAASLPSPATLADSLRWQLDLSAAASEVRRAAHCIVGNLTADAYLELSLAEVAQESGTDLEAAVRALSLVQGFDPSGVAARDLQECLLLQLRASRAENTLAYRLVERNFGELAYGDAGRIAESTGSTPAEAEAALVEIRALDPRPGQRFLSLPDASVQPDVVFSVAPGDFRVTLIDEDLPDLRLSRRYGRLLDRRGSDPAVRSYLQKRLFSAWRLLRGIEQRRHVIQRTCEAIARRQREFLASGIDSLHPMRIKEVAQELGVHPSTVSRAVANKFAQTPHGVYELRSLFSRSALGPSGASVPLVLLKRGIRRMIKAEDPCAPLTDEAVRSKLEEQGIHLTRRSVAKHRQSLGIPATPARRAQASAGQVATRGRAERHSR